MAVTLTIQEIPIGSQLVSAIASDEPETQNDFRVLILLDANGTGLEESDITFSTGASLVSLTGSNSAWEATIRPPTTAQTLTITIAANAFTEGNVETSKDIRLSTAFPDTDAEDPSLLLTPGVTIAGITLTPSRLKILSSGTLYSYTHAGTAVTSENQTISVLNNPVGIDFFNDTYWWGQALLPTRNACALRIHHK